MYRTITHGKSHRNAETIRGLVEGMQGIQQNIQEGSAPQMELMQNIVLNVLKANVEVIEVQQKLLQQIIGSLEKSFAAPGPKAAGAGAPRPEKVKVK
jgi:hypothetical protein